MLPTFWHSTVNPHSVVDVDGAVVEHPVEQERRAQVRRVPAVVGALGMLANPDRIVGRVVEDDVADAEHVPFVAHLGDEAIHVRPGALVLRVQVVHVEQGVGGVGVAANLLRNKTVRVGIRHTSDEKLTINDAHESNLKSCNLWPVL
jgi:hypothetical protein